MRPPHPTRGVTIEHRHRRSQTQVHAAFDVHVGDQLTHGLAQRGRYGRGASLDDCYRQSELATDGRDLRSDEPRADDQHSTWLGLQPRTELSRVVTCPERKDAIQAGFGWVRPRTGARARGDQQAIELETLPTCQLDLLVAYTQLAGRDAEAPVGVDLDKLGQPRMRNWYSPGQELLRKRWSIVWCVGLVTDHHQLASETFRAERLRGPQSGQ